MIAKAKIGLLRNLRSWIMDLKLRDPASPRAMFCSQYVAHCFSTGGMRLIEKPDIATLPKHIEGCGYFVYKQTIEKDPSRDRSRIRRPTWRTP